MCSTAGSSNTFYCAYDYPVDVAKGLSSVGSLCYKTALDCMNGPNACNTSFLCQPDASNAGACKGAAYQFFCSLNAADGPGTNSSAGIGGNSSVRAPSSGSAAAPRAASCFMAALAGVALLPFSAGPGF